MTKKEAEKTIEIKAVKINETEITIEGVSPLIINNFNEKSRQQILDAQMKKTKVKEPRNPIEDFMRANYWLTPMPEEFTEEAFSKALKEGARFGFPAKGIKASIVSGAFRNGMTKDKVSLYGAFLIPDELIEIKVKPEDIVMREDYVRIAHGGTDVRFRPEFRNWSMTFKIQYNENSYSLEQIINFINLGGFSCGLGEMRTEKGGNFGSYRVKAEE
jgi:hypothetical protein